MFALWVWLIIDKMLLRTYTNQASGTQALIKMYLERKYEFIFLRVVGGARMRLRRLDWLMPNIHSCDKLSWKRRASERRNG